MFQIKVTPQQSIRKVICMIIFSLTVFISVQIRHFNRFR